MWSTLRRWKPNSVDETVFRVILNGRAFASVSEVKQHAERDDDPNARKETIDFGFSEVPRQEKETLVGQVFSSVASKYDVMNDLMSGGLHRLWKDRLIECLAAFPGQKHVDVAGGTGDVAFRVLHAIRNAETASNEHSRKAAHAASSSVTLSTMESGHMPSKGSVVVCDINTDMLKEGQQKALEEGIGDGDISWVEGNAQSLPFDDRTFDSYTIAFGIRNVTDRLAALMEARRVLRAGGRFLCLEFSHLDVPVPGVQELYDWYSFNVIPRIGSIVAGDSDSYKYLVESIRMFPSQEEFADMIRAAGFEGVRYENLTGGIVAIHSGVNPG